MSFRLLSTLSLSCAAVCLLSQCEKKSASHAPESEVLAVVAGHPITGKDLLEEAEWRKANRQAVPEPEALLKEMINRLALVERARQSGLDADPETKRRSESLLIAGLRRNELDTALAKMEVTEEELAAAYQARREQFTRAGLDRFSILFQAVPAKASAERRAESRARLEAAISIADASPAPRGRGPAASGFGSVAIEHSDDQISRYRGGDVGWVKSDETKTRLPNAVLEAGRALEKGSHSPVIETEEGYYSVMKTDERPGGVRPLEEVSQSLREDLLREKRSACEQQFVDESLELSKVEIHSDALRKVKLPTTTIPTHSPQEPPAFPGISRPAAAR